jgi:CheY-like chemotaxis protein
VREYHPSALTLDMHLPDMSGWRVLERLKSDLSTRHIPVCVISTDDAQLRALAGGAFGFLAKPLRSRDLVDQALATLRRQLDRPQGKVVVLMAETPLRAQVLAGLGHGGPPAGTDGHDARGRAQVGVELATDAVAACRALATGEVDALVMDAASALLDDLPDAPQPGALVRPLPVVLAGEGHAVAAGAGWARRHDTLALHPAGSADEVLDTLARLLHRKVGELSDRERQAVEAVHGPRLMLEGRKVLIVDDDMRNIFALATVLDSQGMVVASADNGPDAVEMVRTDPSIDIVLMDIMMPEMDGLMTMREIRKLEPGQDLPIIAVTAKAMKGDREKCIEAGAWDYLSKPVDPEQMLAVLRAWLHR